MYAKLMIVIHGFKCPSEASYPVATDGKRARSMFLPAPELFFAILGVSVYVLMNPD